MIKVHKDLVNRDFMVRLSDLPLEQQQIVNNSPFLHFFPWRITHKPDSVSTPVQLVVVTGLNLLLAKGENRLKKINEILLRARTKQFIFTSDVTKLYNMLILNVSSYCYQLFLFHESLDERVQPEVWVMLRAGMVSPVPPIKVR